jgi:hypothetical protein
VVFEGSWPKREHNFLKGFSFGVGCVPKHHYLSRYGGATWSADDYVLTGDERDIV